MIPGTLGGRVTSAAPVAARTVRQGTAKQPVAAGGGALLGTAQFQINLPGTVLSDGTAVTSTGVTMSGTQGDPDVGTSGTNFVYNVSGGTAYYVTTMYVYLYPQTNAVASDVFQLEVDFGPFSHSIAGIGLALRYYDVTAAVRTVGVSSSTGSVQVICTGGTNRTYLTSSGYYVEVARFASA